MLLEVADDEASAAEVEVEVDAEVEADEGSAPSLPSLASSCALLLAPTPVPVPTAAPDLTSSPDPYNVVMVGNNVAFHGSTTISSDVPSSAYPDFMNRVAPRSFIILSTDLAALLNLS